MVCLGNSAARATDRDPDRVCGVSAASVMFFVVTNFCVWALGSLYPKTWEGLLACYVAAIPFFQNDLLGNLF